MRTPIEITVTMDKQGELVPINFTAEGQVYRVTEVSRRWQDSEGQHILVLVEGSEDINVEGVPESKTYLSI